MTLTLSIVRCPDSAAPERREIAGGELTIGRAPDNGWVLGDPAGHLSRRHCVIAFRAGGWQVADTSSNGTFLNREQEPIGPGAPRSLRSGDRLRLGDYEIEVAIAEAESRGRPAPALDPFGADPFGSDPFGAPSSVGSPFGTDPLLDRRDAASGAQAVLLPPDFDPLEPDPTDDAFGAPTQPDHAPALDQAFRPPPLVTAGLPDDWDLDIGGTPLPSAPAASAIPVATTTAAPAPAPAVSSDDLLAAFLRGAEMQDSRPADPAAAMEALGAATRALVAGLRRALIARAAIKSEFRIEQTMVRARGNNPLKFSADDDDALAALLGTGRRTDMTPAAAVADALRDMRLHELATMAAMQTAVRELVARFDPAPIARAADAARAVIPAQRRARAWEGFEALHAQISRALTDDFDGVFGKSFARAYEQALREAADREGPP